MRSPIVYEKVAGFPISYWFNLFECCFEWRFDGGMFQIAKGKFYRTGQYLLREWPQPGGVMKQQQIIVDILFTIANEKNKIANKI